MEEPGDARAPPGSSRQVTFRLLVPHNRGERRGIMSLGPCPGGAMHLVTKIPCHRQFKFRRLRNVSLADLEERCPSAQSP